MALRFFNTYSRELEEFRPLDPDGRTVKMYTCGPTVYSHAHIGNFRAYLFEDLLQRHLESRGYKVARVMNITDVDDKTIRDSREAGIPLAEFTSQYKRSFFADLDTLRIRRADHFPEATEIQYVQRMIAMIETLIRRDLAYQAEDGSVYYRIRNFPGYGQLAHIHLDELQPTGRIRNDEYEKENIGDFALWKAWDPADGDVRWESPWGPGRPGWHIECSAMSTAILGNQLDIHCGGIDNIFPHHEAEIAQSEGCTGVQFVRYWLHCAHLMVEGQKMAKSLGNFYTLRDLLAKGYTGREVRYALMRVHYRAQLNFTWEGMEEARTSLARIDDWLERLRRAADSSHGRSSAKAVMPPDDAFEAALDDDLNISAALGILFDNIRETNRSIDDGSLTGDAADRWLAWWAKINNVLELQPEQSAVPADVEALAAERAQARLARDFAKSDQLRDQIAALGWEVRDTKDGQQLAPRGGA